MSPELGPMSAAMSPELGPAAYHWPGQGCDMSWAGMNPYMMNPYGMLPPQMAMGWRGYPGSSQKSSRARTDSDVGQMTRTRTDTDGKERSRTLSDVHEPHAMGEEFHSGPYTTVMLRNLPNNYSR